MPARFIRPLLIIIAISMLVWIIFWFILSASEKAKGIKITSRVLLLLSLFYVYSIGVLSLTVFPLPFERFTKPGKGINLVPFAAIVEGLVEILHAHKIFTDNFQ